MDSARPQLGDSTGRVASLTGVFRTCLGNTRPAPDAHTQDPLIARLQRGRTLLGMVAAAWLVVAYPLSEGREEFVLGKLAELALACGVLLAGSFIGITAFIVAGTPDHRRDFVRRLRGPLQSVLALAAGPAVIWLSLTTVKGDLIDEADLVGFFSSFTGPGVISSALSVLVLVVGALAAVVVLVVSIPYTIAAAYICVSSCFRASEVHQLLPALLSPLLVWSLFAFQIFDGPDVAAPPQVLYTFLLGGPLTVTALSVWEVRRLRARYGITLRTALGR